MDAALSPGAKARASVRAPAAAPLATAVVGGALYSFGGWGGYEAARRRASAEPPGGRYPGRRHIGVADAAASLLRARPSPFSLAAARLGAALGRLEDLLCDPDAEGAWECAPASGRPGLTAPPLTSADLREAEADPPADAAALIELDAAVAATAAALGAPLPPLPPLAPELGPEAAAALAEELAEVGDAEGVLRLEAAALPQVEALEGLRAAVAGRLDAAAEAVEGALRRRGAAL